jgi:hypothetical protein
MLRHYLAHFDQIRIVLGLIVVLIARLRRHVVLGPLFSTPGHSRPQFEQPRMKAIWKKWNYGFKNTN